MFEKIQLQFLNGSIFDQNLFIFKLKMQIIRPRGSNTQKIKCTTQNIENN